MRLPAARFRSLQTRIVAVFLLLVLVVQLAGYGFIQTAIGNSTRRHAQEELEVGERVFKRLLTQNGQRLAQAAQVLAADFAFREALATRDEATMVSALRNHGGRIRADMAMLVGSEGKLLADTHDLRSAQAPAAVSQLTAQAARGGDNVTVGVLGDKAYQLVAVPIRAPLTIGWVTMGFLIDDALVKDLGALTSLDVSIAIGDAADGWRLLASTLPDARKSALSVALPAISLRDDRSSTVTVGGDEYQTLIAQLGAPQSRAIAAVLQRSLAQAAAPFSGLQTTLLVLTATCLLLSLLGSALMARRITEPLRSLATAARKMEEGDYSHPVDVVGNDEIGDLASAFNHMRDGIAAREHTITELAYSDPLTGLPNRALFNDRIQQAVHAAQRAGGPLSVLTMDLDRFKYVNDTLGHHMGDLLLREVGYRLHQALQRKSDTVARLGGDEFAVLLPNEDAGGATLIARKILDVLAEPIAIESHIVDVGASIGIASYPAHGDDANALMRHADVAMYAAKRANNGFEVYDPRQDQNTPERLSLMSELRNAVERDELTLLYQPKVDLAGRDVNYAEALIRWNHPERGIVSPDKFIPFAEQTGYIKAITRWVLKTAFRQCADWHARGLDLNVSINISARDLHNPDFPRYVGELLTAHKVDPRWVWLEVTESAVMEDPTHALEILERLHAMGLHLSIDDFGTGYSSLAYLKKLPVDELKIDKSFVMGLVCDKDDATIVRSTIDLAHNMGLKVAAEGVEDNEILRSLRLLGCDLAQGYYISRPLAPGDFERWLDRLSAPPAPEPRPLTLLAAPV